VRLDGGRLPGLDELGQLRNRLGRDDPGEVARTEGEVHQRVPHGLGRGGADLLRPAVASGIASRGSDIAMNPRRKQ
jgi:hypothetical protein